MLLRAALLPNATLPDLIGPAVSYPTPYTFIVQLLLHSLKLTHRQCHSVPGGSGSPHTIFPRPRSADMVVLLVGAGQRPQSRRIGHRDTAVAQLYHAIGLEAAQNGADGLAIGAKHVGQ